MAFGDSTEKDVRVALSVTGADEVKATLADIMETLRRLKDSRNDIKLGLTDPTLSAKLDEIKAQLSELSRGDTRIAVKVDGADAAILQLEEIKRLKKEVAGTADIRIKTSGAARAAVEEEALSGGGKKRGIFSRIGGLAGLGENPTSLLGQGGILGVATSPIGLGAIASLLPVIGALTTFGLGAGVGLAGIKGAYGIGQTAQGQITTYSSQIRSLQRTVGGLGTSSAAQRTRTIDLSIITKDQGAIAHLQKVDGAFLQIYKDLQKVGATVKTVFGAALSGGGKNSFISQIAQDLKPLQGMIKGLQGPLTKLFQASAPYVKTFIGVLGDLAKIIIPAVTRALKVFSPYLAGLQRSFQIVFDVIGQVIIQLAYLGKAMAIAVTTSVRWWKTGVSFFKGAFTELKGWIMDVVHAFDDVVGAVKSAISWIGKIASAITHLPGGGILGKALSAVGLSGGGVMPGYAPGRDVIPALLSPGESVLTPEATRAVGAGNVLRLNAMSGRPTTHTAGILHAAGGFLSGGGFGGVGSFGGVGATVINISLSGVITNPDAVARQIQQTLLTLKRHNGNRSLGLT